MKKAFALLLMIALAAGMMNVLAVQAADETALPAVTWSPVEIDLTSSKTYDNPYWDVEVTGTFTHEDGTVISLPGFWYKDNTWKLRFSPTKTGLWTYTVSSNDPANTGFNGISGKIQAEKNTSNTALAQHGFIKQTAGELYFTYDDGTPFFWLGDTHWQAPNWERWTTCNYPGCTCGSQIKHEINDRVNKGFTVYQTYFDGTDSGEKAEGSMWKKTNYTLINADYFNDKVDGMFAYLNEKGMAIAVGYGIYSMVNNMAEEKLMAFARYIVARYACYSILWIAGQEVTTDAYTTSDKKKTAMEVFTEVMRYTNELDGYKHPGTMHQTGGINVVDPLMVPLKNETWHTFHLIQSGHGMVHDQIYYQQYYKAGKLYVEGETNYDDVHCGGFVGDTMPRNSAWTAMMSGCAGFTYGVNGIWANMYSTEKSMGWYPTFNYDPWYMNLDKPGAFEVVYMREFFERLPDWTKLIPRFNDKNRASFATTKEKLLASTEDQSVVVCYFYNNDTSTGKLRKLNDEFTYRGFWFNPRTGVYSVMKESIKTESGLYDLPPKPDKADWVCVLTTEKFITPYVLDEKASINPKDVKIADKGTLLKPVSVNAIGGMVYKKNVLEDRTSALTDGNVSTEWLPFANRVTQTMIFDLGKAYALTQITVQPGENTILPPLRIYASNDQQTWHILADTAIYGNLFESDKVTDTEKLTGTWRYVRLLLENAPNIPENQKVSYKTERSKSTLDKGVYAKTAIAEVSIFGLEASGEPEKENVITEVTPAPTTNPGEPTAVPEEPENKTGCRSFTLPAVVTLIPAALFIRKKKTI